MDPNLLGTISAVTALVATVLGPIVTLAVAKRQFSASVLSANRQRWLETLRDTIAELSSQVVGIVITKAGRKGAWRDGFEAAASDPAIMQRVERVVYLQWRIRLLTNPANADHNELCALIEATLENLRKPELNEPETRANIERITRLSQSILKREWERVKAGT